MCQRYIYKCRRMNKRLRTEITRLDIEINEYKKLMNDWCPHSTKWWNVDRGRACYECKNM